MELNNHKHFHEVIKDGKTSIAYSLKEKYQARKVCSYMYTKDFFLTEFFNKFDKNDMKIKEDFHQKLISGYKSVAANEQLQKEASIWDETLNDAWKRKSSPKIKKNE